MLFADGDLDVIDGLAVPEPLEDRVGEPEHQDVLHRLLAQVMVNAEDLLLVGDSGSARGSTAGRRPGRDRTASRSPSAASPPLRPFAAGRRDAIARPPAPNWLGEVAR